MDVSSSKSDGSSSEEWQDLAKSDFGKVIFSNLYWNSEAEEVRCNFELTEAVCGNPTDSIGFYKVGYDNLSQYIANKIVGQLTFEEQEKASCIFKSEELPELLDGYFQFLYVTYDGEVLGASMPIAVNKGKPETTCNDVVTEKVEDDFLMVRFGLEQQNTMLTNEINKVQEEKRIASYRHDCLMEEYEKLNEKFQSLQEMHEKAMKELKLKFSIELEQQNTMLINEISKVQEEKRIRDCFFEEYDLLNKKFESFKKMHEKATREEKDRNLKFSIDLETLVLEKNDLVYKLSIEEQTNLRTATEIESMQVMINTLTQEKSQLIKELHEMENSVENLTKKKEQEEFKPLKIESLEQALKDLEEDLKKTRISLHDATESRQRVVYENIRLSNEVKNLKKEILELNQLRQLDSISNTSMSSSSQETFLAEQLSDSKFMIQAMEDSKQLVVIEMNELSKKLELVEDKLRAAKTENMLLKANLEVVTKSEEFKKETNTAEEVKERTKKNEVPQLVALKRETNIAEKEVKEITKENENPQFSEDTRSSITDLISVCSNSFCEQDMSLEELQSKNKILKSYCKRWERKTDSLRIKCKEIQEKLEHKLTEEAALKAKIEVLLKEKSTIENDLKEQIENLEAEKKDFDEKVKLLKKDCSEKDAVIENLKVEMEKLKLSEAETCEDLKMRLEAASEEYRQLFKEKLQLISKLKKKMPSNRSNSELSVTSCASISSEDFPGSTPSNEETVAEVSPTNNDCDTGEHVRTQINMKEILPSDNTTEEICDASGNSHFSTSDNCLSALWGITSMNCLINSPRIIINKEEKQQVNSGVKDIFSQFPELLKVSNISSAKWPESLKTYVNDSFIKCKTPSDKDQVERILNEKLSKAHSDGDMFTRDWSKEPLPMPVQPESTESYKVPLSTISCSMCGDFFPEVSLPDHYRIIHDRVMCPVCGQLFENIIPNRYLTIHVNEHFERS